MGPTSSQPQNGYTRPAAPSYSNQPASQAEFTSAQLGHWRQHINDFNNPVIVFGAQAQPILLNDALRQRLSEPTSIPGTNQPIAFVWQTICETTGRLVAAAALKAPDNFAEAFPVQGRCFTAVGTLIRSESGSFLGAVINLADLTGSKNRIQELFSDGATSGLAADESAEEYSQWTARRELARQRMAKLSRRESQVVALVSNGFPNKSIAHELDISVKTIEKHRANATRKLGVSSTPEMVRIAVVADQQPATPPQETLSLAPSPSSGAFAIQN